MINSIMFNWPSGAGGDFIMAMVHLVKQDGATPMMHYPNNKFNAGDREFTYIIRTFGEPEPIDLLHKEFGHIIYTHNLQLYDNRLPDNVQIINIDNTGCKFFTDLLFILKSKKSQVYDLEMFNVEMISNFDSIYGDSLNYHNFKYEDIISLTPNRDKVAELFALFDVTEQLDKIIDCIILYADVNYRMIRAVTVRTFEELPDKDAYAPTYDLRSLDHLHSLLTKKQTELL